MATEGLTHIHLIVRDLDRSLRFYQGVFQGVFGLEEQFRDGPKMVFLGTPGRADTITLNEDPRAQDRAGDNGGVAHFGFRLLDKSDSMRRLPRSRRLADACYGEESMNLTIPLLT